MHFGHIIYSPWTQIIKLLVKRWYNITCYARYYLCHDSTKAELLQVGILFGTQFSSLGIFINKKVGF
jgi:hypothetical protein